ncbi:MAG TPA: DUF2294 domain-containing protein [Solirubrobacteraceae bacterium]|jgi:uncharacterized protein YbcI|nr:DUF2294 domain-containing protein [Solirubrobacteraceae bacterium]
MSSAHMPLNRGERGERALEISNLIVKLVSEYTGRGPTRARTYLNDDLVTVVLRDALTKGEQSLVSDGKSDLVLQVRLAFQQTMKEAIVSGVERITGRKVVAFLSANHIEPDIAIESFVLDGAAGAADHSEE